MSQAVDIELPENLTISNAHKFHDELEELIEKQPSSDLVLHADKVNRADTSGIQLILALVQSSKERQVNVSWEKPSDTLIDAATVLGLSTSLGLH
jgi:anti-anti-sigma factor